MQMNCFRETLIQLSLKYIPCSLKWCIIHVYILNGCEIMQFWHLKGPFCTTAIKYTNYLDPLRNDPNNVTFTNGRILTLVYENGK